MTNTTLPTTQNPLNNAISILDNLDNLTEALLNDYPVYQINGETGKKENEPMSEAEIILAARDELLFLRIELEETQKKLAALYKIADAVNVFLNGDE